jgi:hypothetical protein
MTLNWVRMREIVENGRRLFFAENIEANRRRTFARRT